MEVVKAEKEKSSTPETNTKSQSSQESQPENKSLPTTQQVSSSIANANVATAVVSTVGKKTVRHSSAKARESKRVSMEKDRIYRDRSINADIDIDPAILAFLYSYVQEHPDTEINGFGHVDADGHLDWASIVSIGTGASVASSPADMAWATTDCIEATGDVPNMQLHTHPGFDTFFSGTDTNDIVRFVSETRDGLDVEYGAMYFMIYNMEAWLIRKVEWSPLGAFYNDGLVYGDGVPFANTTVKNVKSTAITKSYGAPVKANTVVKKTETVEKDTKKPEAQAKKDKPETSNGGYRWTPRGYNSVGQDDLWDDYDYAEWNGRVIVVPEEKSLVDKEVKALTGAANSPTVRVPFRKPLKNDYTISDLMQAYSKEESLLSEVIDLQFYDLFEIREFMKDLGDTTVWDLLEKELTEHNKKHKSIRSDPSSFVEYILKSYEQGNIADAAMILNLCSWELGNEVLGTIEKEEPALHNLLTRSASGYTFGSIIIMISENFSICATEAQAQEANMEILSKLPPKVSEEYSDYIIDAWDAKDAMKKGAVKV